jgi:hypothetical protein
MSTTKPTTLPEWDTNGTQNNEEPSSAVKSDGIVFGSPSKSSYHNWWMKLVYEWLDFINRFFATPDANTLTISDGTTVRATVDSSGVTIPDLNTTTLDAPTITTDALSDSGAGSIDLTTDVLPTDNSYDLGGSSNRFSEVHAMSAMSRQYYVTSAQATANSPGTYGVWQISRHTTPVAFGRVECDADGNWSLDTLAPYYNVVDADIENVFWEVLPPSVGSAQKAMVACRIRLTEHTTSRRYQIFCSQATRGSDQAGLRHALGVDDANLSPADDESLFHITHRTINIGANFTANYESTTVTDEPSFENGDLLVVPCLTKADVPGSAEMITVPKITFADATAYNARADNRFDTSGEWADPARTASFSFIVYGT